MNVLYGHQTYMSLDLNESFPKWTSQVSLGFLVIGSSPFPGIVWNKQLAKSDLEILFVILSIKLDKKTCILFWCNKEFARKWYVLNQGF